MQKICYALNCSPEDLIENPNFNYDDEGRLIVDKLYYDPRISNGIVCEINDTYYLLPALSTFCKIGNTEKQIKHTIKHISQSAQELPLYDYALYKCVPREGFDVEVGRSITTSELEEIKKKYNLTDDTISSEFVDTKGNLYGSKYAKSFVCIQIKVSNGDAIAIETGLKEKGIQAANIAAGRVNIRVK